MKIKPINEYSEWTIEANRARYREELALGIYNLMVRQKVNRTALAKLMGFESKSRITHILSGEKNLQADTLADILLVLGRTPHLVLATDFDAIRFAVDEGIEAQNQSEIAFTEFYDDAKTDKEIKPLQVAKDTNVIGRIGFDTKFVRLAD